MLRSEVSLTDELEGRDAGAGSDTEAADSLVRHPCFDLSCPAALAASESRKCSRAAVVMPRPADGEPDDSAAKSSRAWKLLPLRGASSVLLLEWHRCRRDDWEHATLGLAWLLL